METKDLEKTEQQDLQKRERSRNYPGASLARCVDFLGEIKKEMSFRPFSRQSLASAFSVSSNSGAFSTKLAALSHFGLINGSASSLSIAELGKRIINPRSEEERMAALQEAFAVPPLYTDLLESFAGNVLPKSLANILFHEYGLTETAKDVCAKAFEESAVFAGLVDESGVLKRPGTADCVGTFSGGTSSAASAATHRPVQPHVSSVPSAGSTYEGYDSFNVVAVSGKPIYLAVPKDIDSEDVESIKDVLEMLDKRIQRRQKSQQEFSLIEE